MLKTTKYQERKIYQALILIPLIFMVLLTQACKAEEPAEINMWRSADQQAARADKERDYDLAILKYKEAIRIIKREANQSQLFLLEYLLAHDYEMINQYDEAEKHFLLSLESLKKWHPADDPQIAKVNKRLAGIYRTLKKFDEAKKLYAESLVISERHKEHNLKGYVELLITIGDFNYEYDNYRVAQEKFLKAKKILDIHPEYIDRLIHVRLILASIYRNQNNYNAAEQMILLNIKWLRENRKDDFGEFYYNYNQLGIIYLDNRKYKFASGYLHKSLSILKKYMPNEKIKIASVLGNLAVLNTSINHLNTAEKQLNEALSITNTHMSADSLTSANYLFSLGNVYRAKHDNDKALKFYIDTLSIRKKILPPDHQNIVRTELAIAGTLGTLPPPNPKKAETLLLNIITKLEKKYPDGHSNLSDAKNSLGTHYLKIGKLQIAKRYFKEAFRYYEKKQVVTENSNKTRSNLAIVYLKLGDYSQAENIFVSTYKNRKKTLPKYHPYIADSLNSLGMFYFNSGRYNKADKYLKDSVDTFEKSKSIDHIGYATALSNLSVLYTRQKKYFESLELGLKALEIRQQYLSEDHKDIFISLNNLAAVYNKQLRYPKAESYYIQAKDMLERLSPDLKDPRLINIYSNLAHLYSDMSEAIILLKGKDNDKNKLLSYNKKIEDYSSKAYSLAQTILPEMSVEQTALLNNMGHYYLDKNKYIKSMEYFEKAKQILEHNYPDGHPDTATVYRGIALNFTKQENYDKAEFFHKKALAIFAQRLAENSPEQLSEKISLATLYQLTGRYYQAYNLLDDAITRLIESEETSRLVYRYLALAKISVIHKLITHTDDSITSYQNELSDLFQLVKLPSVTNGMLKLAQTLSSESSEVQNQVKDYVDTRQQILKGATLYKTATTFPEQALSIAQEVGLSTNNITDPSAVMLLLRQHVEEQGKLLEGMKKELSKKSKKFNQLVNRQGPSLDNILSSLKSDEAILNFAVGDKATFIMLIRPGLDLKLIRIDIDKTELREWIRDLRSPLVTAEEDLADNDKVEAFDLNVAHVLYHKFFEPFLPSLEGVKHIIIVADDAFEQLPFQVLVTEPHQKIAGKNDYSQIAFFAKQGFSFSYQPSLYNFTLLRQELRPGSQGTKPFIGFGDPKLQCKGNGKLASMMENLLTKLPNIFRGNGSSHQDVAAAIQELCPLKDASEELITIASLLKVKQDDIVLGEDATETLLKSKSRSGALKQYKIISFSTHKAVSSHNTYSLMRDSESGLVMTPPAAGSVDDDGFLSSSEIASLTLDADWVILSACDTAGVNIQALYTEPSDLVDAFFVAGTRSILASQWPVSSHATKLLMTGLFKQLESMPTIRRAEATRISMTDMIESKAYSHPLYWAAFVVIGEGGAIPQNDVSQEILAPKQSCNELASYPEVNFNDIDPDKTIPACEEAVKQFPDNMDLQFQLGRAFQKAEQYNQAFKSYLPIAKNGHVLAQSNLGVMYLNAQGREKDDIKAIEWSLKSANNGFVIAQQNLGDFYYNTDIDQSRKWYQLAAKQGSSSANFSLGHMYLYQVGVERNYQLALDYFKKSAEAGNSSGMTYLGYLYENGIGVEKNYHIAKYYYRRSVVEDASALISIGDLYKKKQNYKKAIDTYKEASSIGVSEGLSKQAEMYMTGKGVQKDCKKAHELLKKSIEKVALSGAMNNLGLLYYDGCGVKQNYKKAMAWFKESQSHGNIKASYNIGKMYYFGKGVKENKEKASELYNYAKQETLPELSISLIPYEQL